MESVSIGGGLARSQTLEQILADVLAMPVDYYGIAEVTLYEAAMCAAVRTEVYPDLVRCGEDVGPKPRLVCPDKHGVKEYARCHEKWVKAAKWLDSLGEETM
jgi:sugar (pentulose or hexulose) kinase